MKKVIAFLVILFSSYLYSQVETSCYNFETGQLHLTSNNIGLFRTYEDFVAGKEEVIENITLTNKEVVIRKNKKTERNTFKDVATSYWGYHNKEKIYRFDIKFIGTGFATQISCIGNITLYCNYTGIKLSEPSSSDKGFSYKYTYVENAGLIRISKGPAGELIKGTNENFSSILKSFDPKISDSYLADFASIKNVKLENMFSENEETTKLFVKYFELINNSK